jgi:hypothetical protein
MHGRVGAGGADWSGLLMRAWMDGESEYSVDEDVNLSLMGSETVAGEDTVGWGDAGDP